MFYQQAPRKKIMYLEYIEISKCRLVKPVRDEGTIVMSQTQDTKKKVITLLIQIMKSGNTHITREGEKESPVLITHQTRMLDFLPKTCDNVRLDFLLRPFFMDWVLMGPSALSPLLKVKMRFIVDTRVG